MADLDRAAVNRIAEMVRAMCKGKNHAFMSAGQKTPVGQKCCCGQTTWKGENDGAS